MFKIFTHDNLKKKHISIQENSKIAEGTYGKVYLQKSKIYKTVDFKNDKELDRILTELTIHDACYRVRSRLRKNTFETAKIPKILDVYMNNNTIIVVMEKAGDFTLHKTFESEISKENNKITPRIMRQVCAVIYQISMLLLLLQKKIEFVHRDLHTSNIMLSLSTHKNTCGDPLYNTYLIDFGFSRIRINNEIIHSDVYFKLPLYKPRFDMTLLIFDIFHFTFKCKFLQKIKCTRDIPKKAITLWLKILKSTGIKFKTVYNEDEHLKRGNLYNIIMNHHQSKRELTSINYIQKQLKLLIHELCVEQEDLFE